MALDLPPNSGAKPSRISLSSALSRTVVVLMHEIVAHTCYGLYCLEACIVAAVLHVGWPRPKTHRSKEKAAIRLSTEHGLPDVAGLLVLLNDVRKHEAYGDVVRPDELDPENAARQIEDYVESVSRLIG